LTSLRNAAECIKGRCRFCRFFPACGGGLRIRAEMESGDIFAPDPACYLTDEETGLTPDQKVQLIREGQDYLG
jgi:MoaA/NifB/PqqE/SkfB family radical SAM enzyme